MDAAVTALLSGYEKIWRPSEITAGMGLLDLKRLATLRRVSRKEFQICLTTLLRVITAGVRQGVSIGLAGDCFSITRMTSKHAPGQ